MSLVSKRSSSKKKKKLTKVQEQQKKDFDVLCAKWHNAPKFGPKYGTSPKVLKLMGAQVKQGSSLTGRFLRTPEMQELKPRSGKFDRGSTAPVNTTQYTGTRMLGVGQMAKSNAVPVFEKEHIIEIARMRRG